MERTILVPIDFGSQSLIALDYAKFYSSLTQAKIHLLTVVEETGVIKKFFSPDIQEKLINQAKSALNGLASEKLTGFEYETHIATGKVYEQIEKLAAELEPMFILMGKTEEVSVAKRFIGSNTLHLIEESDIPVVSIRGKNSPEQLENTILLPIDVTKPFKEQLNAAIDYAKLFNSKIFALSVDIKDSVAYETQLLTTLNKVKKTIQSAGLQCETEIIESDKSKIVDIISKKADELQPLLTVIMTHDETSLNQIFVGSTAKQIIETLNYPVLSIKPWNPSSEEHPLFKLIYDPMNIF